MISFNLSSQFPPVVHYGNGVSAQISQVIEGIDHKKILIVTDRILLATGMIDVIKKSLPADTLVYGELSGEPRSDDVEKAVEFCRRGEFNLVIGIGGGSVLDTAKVIAVLANNRVTVVEAYCKENVPNREVPLALIPTTAGTGSEATPNALIFDSASGNKEAIISRHLIPDWVFLDPELTLNLPPRIAAATGMDALCHCLESYISVNGNPISEAYAYEGLKLIGANLDQVGETKSSPEVRGKMLLGSFCGGLALTIAGTTAVHALSYPLGKRGVAHGVANGMLLPWVLQYNLASIIEKLNHVAGLFTASGKAADNSEELVALIFAYVKNLPIPKRLSEVGISAEVIPQLAREAICNERLLKNNPRPVACEDAEKIYRLVL